MLPQKFSAATTCSLPPAAVEPAPPQPASAKSTTKKMGHGCRVFEMRSHRRGRLARVENKSRFQLK